MEKKPKKQNAKMLSVLLAEKEHEHLSEIAQEFGISKSEFVRSLIQGAYVSWDIKKQTEAGNKDVKVEFGGYGYHVDFEAIQILYNDIHSIIGRVDEVMKNATVFHENGVQKNRRFRAKNTKKTA